uniref:GMC oxidoreductase n=1 Tax=Paractinoplanes polyasparticus TaxID=2856853 RepID=UPI001C84C70B|nr:GMC oxidoreductase [Actinoplanes polyasparticus]
MVESEVRPGEAEVTEQTITDYALRDGQCSFHAIGACAMGVGPDAVLDPQLRVRGIDSLRVMDASVLPRMVSGNPNGPLIAMSTLAARRILAGR